jgi:transcriptional regulator with XRE-family HTH domain
MRTMLVRSAGDLGAAVAEARRLRGLTQEQLASQSGIERTYLARLEAGASVLLLNRSLQLLRRLGAEVIVNLPESPSPGGGRSADGSS